MQNLLILGARQHAKVITSIVNECCAEQLRIVGFLDADPALEGQDLLGYPILGP